MKYYLITSILTGPGIIIALPLQFFRYHTLRYRFDDEGIAMSWGILFRREIYLTYRRIQDIHVTRGILQRWLGIATISVQTAAGSSGADMQIEGIREYDALRDFLYRKMRGAHAHEHPQALAAGAAQGGGPQDGGGAQGGAGLHAGAPAVPGASDEALALLRQIRDELQRMRAAKGGAQ